LLRRFLAIGLLLASIAGCTSPPGSAQVSAAASAQAGAVQVACASFAALQTSADQLRALDPATTSQYDYMAAVDAVRGTYRLLQVNLQVVSRADADLVTTAWNGLSAAFDAQGSLPVPQALAAVKPQADQFAAAVKQVRTNLNCS
jgi:hypothetical protein